MDLTCTYKYITPPKTNISPEKCFLEDDFPCETVPFEVTCYFFPEYPYLGCFIESLISKLMKLEVGDDESGQKVLA